MLVSGPVHNFSFERNMNLTLKLRGELYKYWHGFSKAHDKGILSAKSGQVLLASCEGNGDFVSDGARTRPKPKTTLLEFYPNIVIKFTKPSRVHLVSLLPVY